MMDIRMFDPEKDYADVCQWWERRKWPPVALHALSSFGLLLFDGELKIACGWLYLTTGSISDLEWLVTNPDAPLKARVIGLECLLDRLVNEAKGFKAGSVFSSLKSKSLIRLYKKHGFTVGDTGMTNMIYTFHKDALCR